MRHSIPMSFTSSNDAALLSRARSTLKAIAKFWEKRTLPADAPSMEALYAALELFQDAYDAAINRDRGKIRDRKAARKAFLEIVTKALKFVEATATDDNELVSAGFDLSKPAATRPVTGLPDPINLTLRQGPKRGSLYGAADAQRSVKCIELHWTQGDPTVEENWSFLGIHIHAKDMLIEDVEPGKQCSVRARAYNDLGKGPWSPPITITPN